MAWALGPCSGSAAAFQYLAKVCCSAILHREVTSAVVIMGYETQTLHHYYD